MLLSTCDKCRQSFNEDTDEMIYCDKCDDYLCSGCYINHHNNLNQLLYVYSVNIYINKYCSKNRLYIIPITRSP